MEFGMVSDLMIDHKNKNTYQNTFYLKGDLDEDIVNPPDNTLSSSDLSSNNHQRLESKE